MTERKASMGDKVYRGDVVKFIRNNISLDTFMKRTVKTADEACWDLCDKLNYVPAIEEKAELHWIPVEQDTPTEDGDYLCTFGAETGRFVDWCSWYHGRWVVWLGDIPNDVSNVVAWCKPMEPYKGVTDDRF